MAPETTAPTLGSRPRPNARSRRAALLLLVLTGTAWLVAPTPAAAHLALESTSPEAEAQLQVAPRVLRLTFTRAVEPALSRLTLIGPRGAIPLAELRTEAADVLVVPVSGALTAGSYTVRWQTAGRDGHPIRGEYTFEILPGAQGLAADTPTTGSARLPVVPEPSTEPPSPSAAAAASTAGFDAGSPLYAAVRWLTFLGILGVIGTVAFRVPVLWNGARQGGTGSEEFFARAARAAAGFGMAAAVVLMVAALLRLYAQAVALFAGDAIDLPSVGAVLTGSAWGAGWLAQAASAVAAFLGFLLARRGAGLGWWLAAVGAGALAFTPALSGHAIGVDEGAEIAVLTDGLHVLGAGGWLGSLLLVLLVGIPSALRTRSGARGETVALLVHAFSPVALAFAGLVVVTGIVSASLHLGSARLLWGSEYGRILLLKLAIVAGVFAAGAFNWLRLRPALGTETAAHRLRRSATLELVLGAVVLAVTAVLVATSPPADPAQPALADQSHAAYDRPSFNARTSSSR